MPPTHLFLGLDHPSPIIAKQTTAMLFLLFAATASARVMDRLAAVPKGWEQIDKASSSDLVALKVALRQPHAEALERAVMEMSTPGHPNYGMHMTREELRSYTAPSQASTSAVVQWLREYGVVPSLDNEWVSFTTTVATADKLLNTTFDWYQYSSGGGPQLRTLSYSVPDSIAYHIDLVQPTTRFGQLAAHKSTIFEMHRLEDNEEIEAVATKANFAATSQSGNAVECGTTITPACLKSLYNINYTASAGPENKVAFCSYLEEYARYEDLGLFQDRFAPAAKGQTFSVELVNGGLNDQNAKSDSGRFGYAGGLGAV